MPFAQDQNMIQALAAKRPDQAFHIWVLPGRARCDRAVAYAYSSRQRGVECDAVHQPHVKICRYATICRAKTQPKGSLKQLTLSDARSGGSSCSQNTQLMEFASFIDMTAKRG